MCRFIADGGVSAGRAPVRQLRCGQQARTHQELVDGSRCAPALVDGPDYERLAAPAIARGEHAALARHESAVLGAGGASVQEICSTVNRTHSATVFCMLSNMAQNAEEIAKDGKIDSGRNRKC